MRKLWLLAMAAALGIVGPAAAQFSLTSSSGARTAQTLGTPQTVGVTQMLPKTNVNSALVAPIGNTRTFNFANLLPNFGFTNNRWPIRPAQFPRPNVAPKK